MRGCWGWMLPQWSRQRPALTPFTHCGGTQQAKCQSQYFYSASLMMTPQFIIIFIYFMSYKSQLFESFSCSLFYSEMNPEVVLFAIVEVFLCLSNQALRQKWFCQWRVFVTLSVIATPLICGVVLPSGLTLTTRTNTQKSDLDPWLHLCWGNVIDRRSIGSTVVFCALELAWLTLYSVTYRHFVFIHL